MKKFLLGGMFIPLFAQAQWNVNLYGGFSNYFGDLQSQAYTTQQSHLAFGAGLQYDLNAHFSALTNFVHGHVGAWDGYNTQPDLKARNLSFGTDINEVNLLMEWNVLDLRSHQFTPYFFAGVAVFRFNPYAYDTTGRKIFLRPLSTEGEGLPQYPGDKEYSLTQLAIPFGGGIKFRVSDNVVIAYDIGFRKLFTDYLDDVSNRYVSEDTLLADRGPLAVEMAYRGNQLKGGSPYPKDGTVRGNPKHDDWYYMSGLRVIIALNTNAMSAHRRHNGVLDCPKKVY